MPKKLNPVRTLIFLTTLFLVRKVILARTLILIKTLMDANFSKDDPGRIFLEGCSWTVIFGRRLMDAHYSEDGHFSKDAHGRSF